MRLLVVLNENPAGSQDDWHNALHDLVADETSLLSAVRIYPYLARLTEGLDSHNIETEISIEIRDFLPDAILFCHATELILRPSFIEELKSRSKNLRVAYWDGDVYQRFYKPLPRNVVSLARMCDVSFWPAYSPMIEQLRRSGCRDMRYTPLPTCPRRFGMTRLEKPEFEVVMVGNKVTSKIPFKRFPGSRRREQLVSLFKRKLGKRFAIYGHGWRGECAQGPIPFIEQGKAYHKGRISIGVNNLFADYYFSDRLPISLSSGVLMVHNRQRGYDAIFQKAGYSSFYSSVDEAWNMAEQLLNADQEVINCAAQEARQFAISHLSQTRVLHYVVDVIDSLNSIFTLSNKGAITNPWIGGVSL